MWHLGGLPSLRRLTLSDPVWPDAPIAKLGNYRMTVIGIVRSLGQLDLAPISQVPKLHFLSWPTRPSFPRGAAFVCSDVHAFPMGAAFLFSCLLDCFGPNPLPFGTMLIWPAIETLHLLHCFTSTFHLLPLSNGAVPILMLFCKVRHLMINTSSATCHTSQTRPTGINSLFPNLNNWLFWLLPFLELQNR